MDLLTAYVRLRQQAGEPVRFYDENEKEFATRKPLIKDFINNNPDLDYRSLYFLCSYAEMMRDKRLPIIFNSHHLAEFLGLSYKQLIQLQKERDSHYNRFTIPKRSGGMRIIEAPSDELKSIQRKILQSVLASASVHPAAHGFRRNRSIVTTSGGTCAWSATPGLTATECTATFTGQSEGVFWVRTTYADTVNHAFKCSDTAKMTVSANCCVPVLNVDHAEVAPKRTGVLPITSKVSVSLQTPAPPEGCVITMSVEAVESSGGHDQAVHLKRTTGTLSSNSISFAAGESGPIDVTYFSSEIGGSEKIVGKVDGSNKKGQVQIDVTFPGLIAMGAGQGYRLTGASRHSNNHYGTSSTIQMATYIASDFASEHAGAKLGINDLSLVDGGVFDMRGNWSSPHVSHRKGTSVDIDGCARNYDPYTTLPNCSRYGSPTPLAFVEVPRLRLEQICIDRGGYLVPEETNHCELLVMGMLNE